MTRMSGSVPEGRMTRRPSCRGDGGVFDRCLDRRLLERLAAGNMDILQQLRHRSNFFDSSLTGRFCRLMQASTCSAETSPSPVVEKSDNTMWPDVHTDIQPMRTHVLDDIAVADLGAVQLQLHVAEEAFEAEIGHHRRDDATPASRPLWCQDSAISAMIWSPSTIVPFSSTIDDAVGVAVERDADVARTSCTFFCKPAGWVEPHSLLMLKPLGSTLMATTSAPSSHSASGATL